MSAELAGDPVRLLLGAERPAPDPEQGPPVALECLDKYRPVALSDLFLHLHRIFPQLIRSDLDEETILSPLRDRLPPDHFDFNLRNPGSNHPERLGRAERKIEDAISVKRTPVIHLHPDGPAIIEVGYPQEGPEGKGLVSRRQIEHIVNLAAARRLSMKIFSIPRSEPPFVFVVCFVFFFSCCGVCVFLCCFL